MTLMQALARLVAFGIAATIATNLVVAGLYAVNYGGFGRHVLAPFLVSVGAGWALTAIVNFAHPRHWRAR